MANTISRAGDGGSYKSSPKPKSEPAPKQKSEPAPKKEAPSSRQTPIRAAEVEAPKKAAPAPKPEPPAKAPTATKQTPIRAAEVEAPKKVAPAPKPEPPAKVAPVNKPTAVRADQEAPVKTPIVAKPEATIKVTPTPTVPKSEIVTSAKNSTSGSISSNTEKVKPDIEPQYTRAEVKPTEKKIVESTDCSRERARDDGMGYAPPVNNSTSVNVVATNQSSTKVAKETSATATPVHKPQQVEESQSTKPVAKEVYVSSKITKENDPITKDVKVVNNNNKVQNYSANTGTTGKTYEKAKYGQYDEVTLDNTRNYNQKGQTKPILIGSHSIATPKPLGTTGRRDGILLMNAEGIVYSDRISGKKTGTGNQVADVIKLGDSGTDVLAIQQKLQNLNILKAGYTKGQFDQSTLNAVNQFKNQYAPSSNQGSNLGVITDKTLVQMDQKLKEQEAKANAMVGGFQKQKAVETYGIGETVPTKADTEKTVTVHGVKMTQGEYNNLLKPGGNYVTKLAEDLPGGIWNIPGNLVNAGITAISELNKGINEPGYLANKEIEAIKNIPKAYKQLSKLSNYEVAGIAGIEMGKNLPTAVVVAVATHKIVSTGTRIVGAEAVGGEALSIEGGLKTELDYVTSNGLKLEATPGKTTTVLGTFNSDTGAIIDELGNVKSLDFSPKDNGFNLLNTPDELYISPDQFWNEYNKLWLDEAVQRNDIIKIATEPTYSNLYRINNMTGIEELTGFGREFLYLNEECKYTYDSVTKTMIPPK